MNNNRFIDTLSVVMKGRNVVFLSFFSASCGRLNVGNFTSYRAIFVVYNARLHEKMKHPPLPLQRKMLRRHQCEIEIPLLSKIRRKTEFHRVHKKKGIIDLARSKFIVTFP